MPKAKEEKNYGFPDKWDKLLTKYSSFKDDANTMSDDDLRAKILECEVSIKEQERSRDADADLQRAKDVVKAISGGYRDSIALDTAKIKYSLYMLETRGKI